MNDFGPMTTSTLTAEASKPLTEERLLELCKKFNEDARKSDSKIVAFFHNALGFEPAVLEVHVNGRPYLSARVEGKVLVLDMVAAALPCQRMV